MRVSSVWPCVSMCVCNHACEGVCLLCVVSVSVCTCACRTAREPVCIVCMRRTCMGYMREIVCGLWVPPRCTPTLWLLPAPWWPFLWKGSEANG